MFLILLKNTSIYITRRSTKSGLILQNHTIIYFREKTSFYNICMKKFQLGNYFKNIISYIKSTLKSIPLFYRRKYK